MLAGHAAAGRRVYAVAVPRHRLGVCGTPLAGPGSAVLSSGTWSLLGVEFSEPQLGGDADAFNLTNERGSSGTVRLLRNVMGMWLIQECRRAWTEAGRALEYEELPAAARRRRTCRCSIPTSRRCFAAAMPAMIARVPSGRPAGARRDRRAGPLDPGVAGVQVPARARAARDGQRPADRVVQVVGGGVRNALLCQITADMLGLPVLAGPAEATVLGNVLVQARAPARCRRWRRCASWRAFGAARAIRAERRTGREQATYPLPRGHRTADGDQPGPRHSKETT